MRRRRARPHPAPGPGVQHHHGFRRIARLGDRRCDAGARHPGAAGDHDARRSARRGVPPARAAAAHARQSGLRGVAATRLGDRGLPGGRLRGQHRIRVDPAHGAAACDRHPDLPAQPAGGRGRAGRARGALAAGWDRLVGARLVRLDGLDPRGRGARRRAVPPRLRAAARARGLSRRLPDALGRAMGAAQTGAEHRGARSGERPPGARRGSCQADDRGGARHPAQRPLDRDELAGPDRRQGRGAAARGSRDPAQR